MDLGAPTEYAQSMPNANPVHIAALYAFSCAGSGTLSPCASGVTPSRRDCVLRTPLNTIVDTLTPIDEPICVIAWNSAPATLCSCGGDILAMNSVPDANVKSAPSTMRHAEGKPNAQYGALGLITANRRLAQPVRSVPVATMSATSTRPIVSAIMTFAMMPQGNMGSWRSMVWIGLRFKYVW